MSAAEPSDSWFPPSHRADRAESAAHVSSDYWCACPSCDDTRRLQTRLKSTWLLEDLLAMEAAAENDQYVRSIAPTSKPPAMSWHEAALGALEGE